MSDYQNAYAVSTDYLSTLLNLKIINKVNIGLYLFPDKKYFDRDIAELFLKELFEKGLFGEQWIDQTIYAIMISKHKEHFERLSNLYKISFQALTRDAVSHHFVNDGSRELFYRNGLRALKSKRFLKKFNRSILKPMTVG
jgi:hypothetical protein